MATLRKAQLREIVEALPDGILVVDLAGRVCFANPEAERLLGVSAGGLIGENFGSPAVSGDSVEVALVPDDPEGARNVTLDLRLTPIEWEGRPAWLEALRDATRQRQREHEALENVHQRDKFLAVLSHELRNPLSVLAGVPRLLADSLDEAKVLRAREVIARQCATMTRLLDDLLDVARISQDKIHLQHEPVDLAALLRDAADGVRAAAEKRGLTLDLALAPDPLVVDGDAVRLQQVIVNLLTNAIKYSNRGGAVRAVLRRIDDVDALPLPSHLMGRNAGRPLRWACLTVSDDGMGIPPEMLDRIFDPFFQVDSAVARSEGGLGVGLALVRRLVALHGGWVTAHSEGPGKGSEFRAYLPLSPDTADGQAPSAPLTDTHPLRIVLVEDQADVRDMLAELLRLDGHDVHLAADGPSGIERIREVRPDVALVDIGLPGLDGYEVARAVRAQPGGEEVTLVALTGYGQTGNGLPRAARAGFAHHLIKPVHYESLARLLSRQGRSRSPRPPGTDPS
jgi:signal transduction histidine kinase/ActR/RegA family two-component response regulator